MSKPTTIPATPEVIREREQAWQLGVMLYGAARTAERVLPEGDKDRELIVRLDAAVSRTLDAADERIDWSDAVSVEVI
jgi:hypothetical protein